MDTVTLTLAADEPVSLLQITDTHLFAQPDGQLLGIRTAESFQAVLDAVQAQNLPFELILATGDPSQDFTTGSYQRFADMVKPLQKPVFWLPGNHDDGPLMRRVMPDFGISNARQVLLPNWQKARNTTRIPMPAKPIM